MVSNFGRSKAFEIFEPTLTVVEAPELVRLPLPHELILTHDVPEALVTAGELGSISLKSLGPEITGGGIGWHWDAQKIQGNYIVEGTMLASLTGFKGSVRMEKEVIDFEELLAEYAREVTLNQGDLLLFNGAYTRVAMFHAFKRLSEKRRSRLLRVEAAA